MLHIRARKEKERVVCERSKRKYDLKHSIVAAACTYVPLPLDCILFESPQSFLLFLVFVVSPEMIGGNVPMESLWMAHGQEFWSA